MDTVSPVIKRWQHEAESDPEAFWGKAAEQINWFRKWDQVLDWTPPTFRWFVGGATNLSYNCLDRHVERGWGARAALIGLNERGERRVYTYAQLLSNVQAIAASLRGLGVKRGDRVAIYMPTMPEAIMAMLATTRIGAIHLVVFASLHRAQTELRAVRRAGPCVARYGAARAGSRSRNQRHQRRPHPAQDA
jgi:acetyl-CoA synthetase